MIVDASMRSTDGPSSKLHYIYQSWWPEGRVRNLTIPYYNKASLYWLLWAQGVLTTRQVAAVIIQYGTTVINQGL